MTNEPEELLTPRQKAYLEANPEAHLTNSAKTELHEAPAKYVGMGGWLQFLAISLVALGPIITVATTVSDYTELTALYPNLVGSPAWESALQIDVLSTTGYCMISMFAGWCLFKRSVPSTVPIVITCIWVAGPGLAILSLMAFQDMSGGNATAASAGAGFGRPFVYSIIWTTYLLRSRRVKNTYYGSVRMPLKERLEGLDRKKRKIIFFSLCWMIIATLFYTFIAPPDAYAEKPGPSMWAVIFLPPILLVIGIWAYRKFVGDSDT